VNVYDSLLFFIVLFGIIPGAVIGGITGAIIKRRSPGRLISVSGRFAQAIIKSRSSESHVVISGRFAGAILGAVLGSISLYLYQCAAIPLNQKVIGVLRKAHHVSLLGAWHFIWPLLYFCAVFIGGILGGLVGAAISDFSRKH
jgi:hypothetical protein